MSHMKITHFQNHLIHYRFIFYHQNYLHFTYSLDEMKQTMFAII